MIPAKDFARTARQTFEQHSVPYRRGGDTLSGMDSGGFIEYCLRQHGVSCSFSGTNDIFRNLGTECIPLKQAIREKRVVPGVILLHVAQDGGEPQKYQQDGLGNCDFALIAVTSTMGVYPSAIKGRLISTKIEPVSGKANMVMFCKYVDYGSSGSAGSSPLPPADDGIYTTSALRLRTSPSLESGVITTIPKNTRIDLFEYGQEWCRVRYTKRAGLYYDGWCASQYLTLD